MGTPQRYIGKCFAGCSSQFTRRRRRRWRHGASITASVNEKKRRAKRSERLLCSALERKSCDEWCVRKHSTKAAPLAYHGEGDVARIFPDFPAPHVPLKSRRRNTPVWRAPPAVGHIGSAKTTIAEVRVLPPENPHNCCWLCSRRASFIFCAVNSHRMHLKGDVSRHGGRTTPFMSMKGVTHVIAENLSASKTDKAMKARSPLFSFRRLIFFGSERRHYP